MSLSRSLRRLERPRAASYTGRVLPGKRLALLVFLGSCLYAQKEFQVHGYIQGRFTNQEGTPDRLEIRRARVIVSGDPTPDLSFNVQADVLKIPYLMDASLTWKFSRALHVTAGQFKIPFSTESLIPDNLTAPISRARAVNGLVPGRDTGVQGRDTGVEVAGSLYSGNEPLVEYAAGVFRGQTFVEAPNVHYHATAGRVVVHPIRGVTAGGDWYGSFSAPAGAEKRRLESEGGYEYGRLRFYAEQIWARDGTLERRGGYALGSWRISSRWEPVVRADWQTSNIHKANTTSIAYVTGGNFYLGKHWKTGLNTGALHEQGPKGFSSIILIETTLMF
jgi:hypothetical protein